MRSGGRADLRMRNLNQPPPLQSPFGKDVIVKVRHEMKIGALIAAAIGFSVTPALAHTPLFSCYDNGDGTVLCEGGFSDGSSASNVPIKVKNADGETVSEGKMDENSEFEFDKPDGTYSVLFDGGEGHQIEVPGDEIVE